MDPRTKGCRVVEDRTSVVTKGAVDVKWVLIALLFCAVCAMAGWIIGSNRVESSAPVPAAQVAGVIPQAQQTPQVVLVVPEQQSLPTEPTPTLAQAGPARASASPGSSHRIVVPSGGVRAQTVVSHDVRVSAAPRSAGSSMVAGTWIQVTASDGAVVFIGPDGQLVANTGDASGGVINVDPADTPTLSGGTISGDGGGDVVASAGAEVKTSNAGSGAQLTADFIEGYEDHSLHVTGHGNLVTYDDSNVFINHTGDVNANTGDTDSGGLIAVDVHDSTITVGSEREESDDDGDDGEEEDESETRAASSTGSGEGGSPLHSSTQEAATGDGDVTIGGDGMDDISVHVQGNGNVVTEDDSNVLVGGSGATNAQIGDSDTAGAIVMGATDSLISTGCFGEDCLDD